MILTGDFSESARLHSSMPARRAAGSIHPHRLSNAFLFTAPRIVCWGLIGATLGVAIMAASLALALRLEWLNASSALMSGFLLALSLSMLVASIALGSLAAIRVRTSGGTAPRGPHRGAAVPDRAEHWAGMRLPDRAADRRKSSGRRRLGARRRYRGQWPICAAGRGRRPAPRCQWPARICLRGRGSAPDRAPSDDPVPDGRGGRPRSVAIGLPSCCRAHRMPSR